MDPQELLSHSKKRLTDFFLKFGVVGASIGIIQDRKQYTTHFGLRDKENPIKPGEGVTPDRPDDNTLYLMSSVTKPFIGAAVAVLAVEAEDIGKAACFNFDTPVGDVIQELRAKLADRGDGNPLTVGDLLDHRFPFFRSDLLWEDHKGEVLWETEKQIIDLINKLPFNRTIEHLKSWDWKNARNYTNLSFCLAAIVIERQARAFGIKSGKTWHEYLQARVLFAAAMERSTADLVQFGGCCNNVAPGHSSVLPKDWPPGFLPLLQHVRGDFSVETRRIQRSRVSDKGVLLAAPAGLMSTVKDQLLFLGGWMRLWQSPTDSDWGNDLLRRGIIKSQEYIRQRLSRNDTYTYMCGWNPIPLPYTPGSKHRAAGTEGDNTKRLQAGWKSLSNVLNEALGNDKLRADLESDLWLAERLRLYEMVRKSGKATSHEAIYHAHAWPFLVNSSDPPGSVGVTIGSSEGSQGQRPGSSIIRKPVGFYHGGNMVGATSHAFMLPDQETAIVVLCNSRGFFIDGANMVSLALIDCLYQKRSLAEMDNYLNHVLSDLGSLSAAQYLQDVQKHDKRLEEQYEEFLVDDSKELEDFVGKFYLLQREGTDPGLYFDIGCKLAGAGGDKASLTLCRHQNGKVFDLNRKRTGQRSQRGQQKFTLCFAMSTRDWNSAHLGGKMRLNPRAFELTFEREGPNGRFQRVYWNIENLTTKDGKIEEKFLIGQIGATEEKLKDGWTWKRSG